MMLLYASSAEDLVLIAETSDPNNWVLGLRI